MKNNNVKKGMHTFLKIIEVMSSIFAILSLIISISSKSLEGMLVVVLFSIPFVTRLALENLMKNNNFDKQKDTYNKNRKNQLIVLRIIEVVFAMLALMFFVAAFALHDSIYISSGLITGLLVVLLFFLEKALKNIKPKKSQINFRIELSDNNTFKLKKEKNCPYCETVLDADVQHCPSCGANLL